MRALIFISLISLFSCDGLPEGALTLLEVKFINGLEDQPFVGRPFEIQKCFTNVLFDDRCIAIDTVITDIDGKISYGLFHDDNEELHYFRVSDNIIKDSFCMKELNNQYGLGEALNRTMVLKPYLSLLNIEIQKNDEDIEWISISQNHEYPCSPWNRNKRFITNGMSIDTSYQFKVPPFEQIEVAIVTSRFSVEENQIEQFVIEIEDQPVTFRVD